MTIRESGEMYLEHIYILHQQQVNVRASDVAGQTGYSRPSVSRAVHILEADGMLTIDDSGYLHLTAGGLQRAERILERHNTLRELFMSIGVSEETATEDACKIEHDISDETFLAIQRHLRQQRQEDWQDPRHE